MTLDKGSMIGRFFAHVVPGVMRPMRVLWNEVIGFLFIVLGVWALPSAIRSWREFARGEAGISKAVLPAIWIGVMLYFGITSFLRARRISRS